MSQGKKINKKLWYTSFLEALEQSAGNISKTCEAVQVTPQSYYQYRYKDPVFSKKVQHVLDNICLPYLEDIARSRAVQGNDRLLIFMLRNLGKRRWNKDKKYEALAKDAPRKNKDITYSKHTEEQRPPTKAELAAAMAYEEAMEDEEDEDD